MESKFLASCIGPWIQFLEFLVFSCYGLNYLQTLFFNCLLFGSITQLANISGAFLFSIFNSGVSYLLHLFSIMQIVFILYYSLYLLYLWYWVGYSISQNIDLASDIHEFGDQYVEIDLCELVFNLSCWRNSYFANPIGGHFILIQHVNGFVFHRLIDDKLLVPLFLARFVHVNKYFRVSIFIVILIVLQEVFA